MERISQALELARRQREARFEPKIAGVQAQAPAHTQAQTHAERASAPPPPSAMEFTDTVVFNLPRVEIERAQRNRERILPPSAAGALGGPYKLLRTQVLARLDKLHANTLAILSPGAADGKTLTAINLAIALAADAGRTALLVDFDLRNPSVHKRFGFEPECGVEDCLQSRRPVQECMVKLAGYDRLTVLPARASVEHSSELLASQRAIEVIDEIRSRYANRIILFDLPPVMLADDALAFSKQVQAGLVVVAEGRTRRDDVVRTLELLHDLPMVGTVLNGSREAPRGHY